MFTKKRLACFILVLILIVTLLPGCKEGMEQEGKQIMDQIADELIEEGAPTPPPTPSPTPEPTPSPTPMKTGLRFSEEFEKQFDKLWFGANTGFNTFGSDYAVFCDNGLQDDMHFVSFRFPSTQTPAQIQDEYGRSLFGYPINEMYFNGTFAGETDANGDPLQITFDIIESADGYYVYIGSMPLSPVTLVDNILEEYWPANGIVNDELTDDMLMYQGFGYDKANGGSGMYRMWNIGCPDLTTQIFDWYGEKYKDAPGFERSDEDPLVPRISFTYDITGSGGKTTECEVRAEAYIEPGYFSLWFSTQLDF